ncbi:nucleotide-diphospho-sugar transferase [Parachaetomium inaequale]|uniref:Nucleotide-diphospho-sugar transferase n=1 Tax=Parachaetomium inaequale TaxID=2588326 RepID=A0AAN6P9W7_9PEZI|nr:nucleotide-diphospho-sugar transferase [Parachaetomium inaequale]
MSGKTWATVVYDKSCLPGVLVLNHTLRKKRTHYPFRVIMSYETAEDRDIRDVLNAAGIAFELVDTVLADYNGHDIRGRWQKLSAWTLTQYERIVLLDSNQLILRNIDKLMSKSLPYDHIAASHLCTCDPNEPWQAIPSWGPLTSLPPLRHQHELRSTLKAPPLTPSSPESHHRLHTGIIVLRPSSAAYARLINTLNANLHFNEQDVLETVYRDRRRPLSCKYNAVESTMKDWHRRLWTSAAVKVRTFDVRKPWKERGGREVESWWKAWRQVRPGWYGNGHEGGNEVRRELWWRVLRPLVGS